MDLKSSVLKTIIRSKGLGIGKSGSDIRNKKMRSFTTHIVLIIALILSTANAQSNDSFKRLQEISLDSDIEVGKAKTKSKKSKSKSKVDSSIDSLAIFDVDIDLTLGDISFDMSWGDPVANPKIRCNRASNLFGPVRHNADGSIRWHQGFDYYAPIGTPVYSVGSGVVSLIQTHPDYGLCVLVTHKRPEKVYYSFYAHLSSVSVKYGDTVEKGRKLGESGVTGNAYNLRGEEEHLHFEYRTSPKHGARKQANPNAILRTKFYSADPKNKWQANVGVIKKGGFDIFEQ